MLLPLLLVNLLIVLGLLWLPPLTGSGSGSLFARAWFFFALLVFFSNYQRYSENMNRPKKDLSAVMARHPARQPARSAGYKSVSRP